MRMDAPVAALADVAHYAIDLDGVDVEIAPPLAHAASPLLAGCLVTRRSLAASCSASSWRACATKRARKARSRWQRRNSAWATATTGALRASSLCRAFMKSPPRAGFPIPLGYKLYPSSFNVNIVLIPNGEKIWRRRADPSAGAWSDAWSS